MVYQDPDAVYELIAGSDPIYMFNQAWTTGEFFSGFYVSGLSPDIWLELFPKLDEYWGDDWDSIDAGDHYLIAITLGTELQKDAAEDNPNTLNDLIIDSFPDEPFNSQTQMRLWKNTPNAVA